MRSAEININAKWSPNGLTVAGGNGSGNACNQLYHPQGFYLVGNQTFYIADFLNHRIVEWEFGAINGKIVAGGNGRGNRNDQLNSPTDVIVDTERECLIICDRENRRVVQWPLRGSASGETIISDIDCNCLTMDDNKCLYLTDIAKNEVSRWRLGETQRTVVAGGNGEGFRLDQLNYPTFIFVDQNYSVYVSDFHNHRVMKWTKNATEGIVVAGGQGEGNSLTQSYYPGGIIVDQWGTVYVADSESHRVMRWPKGAKEGTVIAGGHGLGTQPNQLNRPSGLLFDQHGNLYVAEYRNHRVQKFEIDTNFS